MYHVCQHYGPGDPDFDCLTSKLIHESHLKWGTLLPNVGTLGLWVLELFAMFATDRRMDKSNAYFPIPYGQGHNKFSDIHYSVTVISRQYQIKRRQRSGSFGCTRPSGLQNGEWARTSSRVLLLL